MDNDTGRQLDKIRKRIDRIKEQLDDAESERDRLILVARASGDALRGVAERAGVSHTWVARLERDAEQA